MKRRAVFVAVALILAASHPVRGQAQLDCQRCHGELELLRQYVPDLEDARAMRVPPDMLGSSAHTGMSCSECHSGFARFPHEGGGTTRTCGECHEAVRAEWGASSHGGTGGGDAVACSQCHGVHDVVPVDSLDDGPALLVMSETCVGCHETQRLPVEAVHQGRAGCHDCHDPHSTTPPERPGSLMAQGAQPVTCGACHESVAAQWIEDAHGAAARNASAPGAETPTCTSCHGAHPVAGRDSAMLVAVERCTVCHEDYAESFADSYHGQATTLGSPETATCADCHGAHAILPAEDSASMVAESNLVETCSACHANANASFVAFLPHADPHDPESNPLLYFSYTFMTWLLVGTMAFFGLHTLLWLARLAIDGARGVNDHGYPRRSEIPLDAAQRGQRGFVWRFRRYHRVTHAAVIVSFFLLVFTGMPLRFSCTPWSGLLVQLLGGVETAGLLHRVGAIITFGYFGSHIAFIIAAVSRASDRRRIFWGRESIVPHPQDVIDLFHQFRWFLGLGPRPRFGRFSYMEKFDYFAVFWGVAIIGGSGLVLWFPEFFSAFVPGWMFNVATVVHADEAMLATLFIFTIHFFNVHLRPEKFPLDAVMFTGRATVDYMEEEHPKISDRIEALQGEAPAQGQKQDAPAPPPTRRQTLVAAVLGFLALGLGLLLIGMMTWVSLC
jgi:cytochrome b subunit of formate dehydrogenase